MARGDFRYWDQFSQTYMLDGTFFRELVHYFKKQTLPIDEDGRTVGNHHVNLLVCCWHSFAVNSSRVVLQSLLSECLDKVVAYNLAIDMKHPKLLQFATDLLQDNLYLQDVVLQPSRKK